MDHTKYHNCVTADTENSPVGSMKKVAVTGTENLILAKELTAFRVLR